MEPWRGLKSPLGVFPCSETWLTSIKGTPGGCCLSFWWNPAGNFSSQWVMKTPPTTSQVHSCVTSLLATPRSFPMSNLYHIWCVLSPRSGIWRAVDTIYSELLPPWTLRMAFVSLLLMKQSPFLNFLLILLCFFPSVPFFLYSQPQEEQGAVYPGKGCL